MAKYILPTQDIVDEVFRHCIPMQNFDFEIDELVNIVIEALIYRDHFPQSFEQQVAVNTTPGDPGAFQEHDAKILNEALWKLYERLYTAILAVGLYDEYGVLHHTAFTFYRDDVVLQEPGETEPPS